jgi:hypothetical protein
VVTKKPEATWEKANLIEVRPTSKLSIADCVLSLLPLYSLTTPTQIPRPLQCQPPVDLLPFLERSRAP